MFLGSFTFVLMILVITVVVPLFIVFHYVTKWKEIKTGQSQLGEGRVAVDRSKLESLASTAKKLDDRLQTLEKLLDAEAPGWRKN